MMQPFHPCALFLWRLIFQPRHGTSVGLPKHVQDNLIIILPGLHNYHPYFHARHLLLGHRRLPPPIPSCSTGPSASSHRAARESRQEQQCGQEEAQRPVCPCPGRHLPCGGLPHLLGHSEHGPSLAQQAKTYLA